MVLHHRRQVGCQELRESGLLNQDLAPPVDRQVHVLNALAEFPGDRLAVSPIFMFLGPVMK